MENNRQFKGIWIPKEVWLNKDLSIQEKMFLLEVDSLQTEDRGCYATNKYFADFFGLSTRRVSQIIQDLKEKKYLEIKYIKEKKAIIERQMRICRPPYPEKAKIHEEGYQENFKGGGEETFQENNIYHDNNNINNPIIIKNNNSLIHVEQVIKYMNELAGTSFKSTTKKTRSLIKARLAEGFTVDELLDVVFYTYKEWVENKKKWNNGVDSDKYFRPSTIFAAKNFEGYLQDYRKNYNWQG